MQQMNYTAQLPIVVIVGPTAGGKTDLSLRLAHDLPLPVDSGRDATISGEIVSADSMQVYRGMDIGTAKPTVAERGNVPHHLIDCVDPTEPFTVHDWVRQAEVTIARLREQQRWPIVVGGTNLYVKALLEGMFEGPQPDPVLRAELDDLSNDQLHARLRQVDPAAGERIHRNDRKRMVRAIEVHAQTGQPITELQQQWGDQGRMRPDAVLIGLDWPTEQINQRINARVRKMVEDGLFEEVRALQDGGLLGQQASEALGYKQVLAHLAGHCTLEEAIERIKIETRRFARKQRTWLKRFRVLTPSLWLPASDLSPSELAGQAVQFAVENLQERASG
ncbi:MAG: tRNA (adenosine(37)-N6)-dimethylallyltransferase MiaA [Planctomycetes bacterium]|nr:tRNA (adenosine(37)-N6)-dimethylallyltransferase MiaA [Planctomycetota bacterium]NOG53009.1 tRNA (adenosine(37)-N6)-dimethylallyltransferase MiaA [Planctomycetota bacterium]